MISSRPMSISRQRSHFVAVGSTDHDSSGPTPLVSDGPTLLTQLSAMTAALVLSTPEKIMAVAVKSTIRMVSTKKAKTERSFDGATLWPLIRTGSTALGCRICLKLLRTTCSSMTPRMHLKPPLVLPAQAPRYMTSPRMTHVRCGHWPRSSPRNAPVVVMNDTVWKRAERKACSSV